MGEEGPLYTVLPPFSLTCFTFNIHAEASLSSYVHTGTEVVWTRDALLHLCSNDRFLPVCTRMEAPAELCPISFHYLPARALNKQGALHFLRFILRAASDGEVAVNKERSHAACYVLLQLRALEMNGLKNQRGM